MQVALQDVLLRRGIMVLTPKNVTVLGGHVRALSTQILHTNHHNCASEMKSAPPVHCLAVIVRGMPDLGG